MLRALSEFPVRPTRLAGESLSGYVHRFHWANGYEVPVTLRGALRQLFLGEHVAPALSPVAGGVRTGSPSDWGQSIVEAADTDPIQQHGKWRSRRYNPIHYCPVCLENNGAHAMLWMLPLIEACPIHLCQLLSRCVVCGSSLSWGALQPAWRCQCGARLSEAQSWPSPVWAVRLASSIAKAAVVAHGESENNTHMVAAKYNGHALRDVYDMLEWAYSLRGLLVRRSQFQPLPRGLRWKKPTARKAPRAWEERILSMDPDTLERALRRLVRWEFRGQQDLLVASRGDGPISVVTGALLRLPATPFAEGLRRQTEGFLEQLSAGISGLSYVQFNPYIGHTTRSRHLVALADWWHCLAIQVAVLRPNMELKPSFPGSLYGSSMASALQILNAVLHASYRGEPVRRYWKLIERWHLPERLQRKLSAEEILDELGNYLAGLTASELAFVGGLVNDA